MWAQEVLAAALEADRIEEAWDPMRLDLEMHSREELVLIAMALATEAVRLIPRGSRTRAIVRLEDRRRATLEDES